MPRYKYQCDECSIIVTVFHGINETLLDCEECLEKQSMKKLLGIPIVVKNKKSTDDDNVGSLTRQYIEENRKILEQQKKESREIKDE
jgi:putative FmdB family regulatory protein